MGDVTNGDTPVSVVVATRNRPEHLRALLAALQTAVRPQDEVVVVDSASTDPAVGELLRSSTAISVRVDRPGLSRARNAGVARSSCPVVAFTDDDCRPEPGWTAAYAAAFAGAREIGFATGRVRADRDAPTVTTTLDEDRPRWFRPGDAFATYGHGANFAVRRTALDAVGPFDEALGAGVRIAAGEDTDMFWRMLRGGWAGCYDPRPSVVHVQWRDRRGYLRVSYNYGLGGAAVGVKRARFEHRPVLRAVLAESVWRNGVLQAWRDVRAGYETGAIASLWRAAGGVVGTVVAARLPMRDDCFAGPVLAPRRDGEQQDGNRAER